jgi:hypothetical protein
VLEPLAFLKRLAALIPPPRQNLTTYRGCLAPNAKLRSELVKLCPKPDNDDAQAQAKLDALPALEPLENARPLSRRLPWAQLLKRMFAHDLLVCTTCGGKRRVVAFLTERKPIQQILAHLGLPHEPPHVAPARAPPRTEMFDDPCQTGNLDTAAP